MSLICGALKWLKDSDERDKSEADKILTGQQRYNQYGIIYNITTISNTTTKLTSCRFFTTCKQGKSCDQKGILLAITVK